MFTKMHTARYLLAQGLGASSDASSRLVHRSGFSLWPVCVTGAGFLDATSIDWPSPLDLCRFRQNLTTRGCEGKGRHSQTKLTDGLAPLPYEVAIARNVASLDKTKTRSRVCERSLRS